MLRIDQLRLLPGEPEAALLSKCARLLRVEPSVLTGLTVLRRAIDARESLTFVYTVAVSAPQEAALLRRCRKLPPSALLFSEASGHPSPSCRSGLP